MQNRSDARAVGAPRYDGSPCGRCGSTVRRVSNGGCVNCFNSLHRKWRRDHPLRVMLESARKRAEKVRAAFSLVEEDLEELVPEVCPIFGTALETSNTGRATDISPSLNKLVPSLGYVRGNVEIISHRANLLINNGTVYEHELILEHMKRTVPREHWGYPPEPPRVVVTLTQSDLRSDPDRVGQLLEQGCTVRIVSDADPARVVMTVSR